MKIPAVSLTAEIRPSLVMASIPSSRSIAGQPKHRVSCRPSRGRSWDPSSSSLLLSFTVTSAPYARSSCAAATPLRAMPTTRTFLFS